MELNKEVDGNQLVDSLLDLCTAALKARPTFVFGKGPTFMARCHSW